MSELKAEIKEHIAVLSRKGRWTLEVNRVSWNGNEPKLDIRNWSEEHEKCSKGITLTETEVENLKAALGTID